MTSKATLHATSVVFCGRGLLICGPSGSGKSDLALRIMDAGGSLIADDYTDVVVDGGKVMAAAPAATAGMMEVRGVGLLKVPAIRTARIDMVLECVKPESVERMPDKEMHMIEDVPLPKWRINPFESSAVAKIRALLHYPFAQS